VDEPDEPTADQLKAFLGPALSTRLLRLFGKNTIAERGPDVLIAELIRAQQAQAYASCSQEQRAKVLAEASLAGNKARRRIARQKFEDIAEAISAGLQRDRKLHPNSPISAVMWRLRQNHVVDLENVSDTTLRRYLRKLGLK
jgi:hypothetical protein